MKITQQDIASQLNISRLTVSKALNGNEGVNSETRDLVLSTAREMGYSHIPESRLRVFANDAKRKRRQEKERMSGAGDWNGQICLFTNLKGSTDAYWASVISGMAKTFTQHGFDLNLCFLDLTSEEKFEFPMNFNAQKADGIIQFGNLSGYHEQEIQKCGLPVVSIDASALATLTDLHADTIMSTNAEPIAELVVHLAGMGHRRIGYVGRNSNRLSNKERFQGYLEGMKRAGLEPLEQDYFCGEVDEISEMLKSHGRLENLKDFPTAFVCFNDRLAIEVIRLLRGNGIRVPERVAVTGFDNLNESVIADLTTVNVNKEELGMCAAETMIWRLENPERAHRMVRVCDAQIIFRNSTGSSILMEEGKE